MATKPQAKNAIDAAVTLAKADMDTILPANFVYKDGALSFGPTRYVFIGDAGGSLITAQDWETTILANLDLAGRAYDTPKRLGRRETDGKGGIIVIISEKLQVNITNFSW